MSIQLSCEGAANEELRQKAHNWWQEAAKKNDVNLDGFDPYAPLERRLAWALTVGLLIAAIYTRFSSKRQHSTDDQVRECIQSAAKNGMYVPPELISVDEAVKGSRIRRHGLNRLRGILAKKRATVLLVFKASRLFRSATKGYQLIQEEVVEEGLRAMSVSQGIDTNDKKTWKLQLQIHGVLDELLLEGIADHVRSGLTGLHLTGWTTGAIGVGYRRKEMPHLPTTNRGLVRTVPEVDPDAAELIRKHAQLLLRGMPLKEGWRRWLAADGPCDPRSTIGRMTYNAYRRLWSNVRLIGRWEFGRKRNQFSTKLDYVRQIDQADKDVTTTQCEELRILDDNTFLQLQQMLGSLKTGPRGPRKSRPLRLWDLVTEFFFCAACSTPEAPIRFYQTGANGTGMQCKNGDLCSCKTAVNREEAVRAVCDQLAGMISRDGDLIESVICRSRELDTQGDDGLRAEIAALKSSVAKISRRIDGLYELAGEGSDEDRKEVQAKIRSAQSERSAAQLEVSRQQNILDGSSATLTSDDVRQALSQASTLLQEAAAGKLNDDGVYQALSIFRRLTGDCVIVHVEQRVGRKRTNVRGVFKVQLLYGAKPDPSTVETAELPIQEASVWLRKPPRVDALAERVHELIDVQKLSLRAAADLLQSEGLKINSGNLWYSYQRYYEMLGQEPPKLVYNNGHRRKTL